MLPKNPKIQPLNATYVDKATMEKMRKATKPTSNHFAHFNKVGNDKYEVIFMKMPSLNGYDFDAHGLNIIQDDSEIGLNAAITPDQLYDSITEMMINTIKEKGHLPWQKEWDGSKYGEWNVAKNYVTKEEYTGCNFWNLNFTFKEVLQPDGSIRRYIDKPIEFKQPFYLTFNQIKEAGATLKKGSKATPVYFMSPLYRYDSGTGTKTTTDSTKWDGDAENKFYLLKYYNVFRADDCENLKEIPKPAVPFVEPIDAAQAVIDNYPNHPKYNFGGNRAFYQQDSDLIQMPIIASFKQPQAYYSTFFHEMVHSTGHESRLGRLVGKSNARNSQDYAFEELVAELGAVFLCAETGILFQTKDNSAAYLKGWGDRLVKAMTEDNKFFYRASQHAKRAVQHILNGLNVAELPSKEEKITVAHPQAEPKAEAKPTIKSPSLRKKKDRSKEPKLPPFNECRYLNPGWYYEKGGKLVHVSDKNAGEPAPSEPKAEPKSTRIKKTKDKVKEVQTYKGWPLTPKGNLNSEYKPKDWRIWYSKDEKLSFGYSEDFKIIATSVFYHQHVWYQRDYYGVPECVLKDIVNLTSSKEELKVGTAFIFEKATDVYFKEVLEKNKRNFQEFENMMPKDKEPKAEPKAEPKEEPKTPKPQNPKTPTLYVCNLLIYYNKKEQAHMDNFQQDYDSTEKEINTINNCLGEIRTAKSKNSSASVATQEYKMKQANLKVRNQMNDLDVLASEYQNSGSRFQISAKDRQKRTDKIFELKKQA